MPIIEFEIRIAAPIEVVFDLCRSVDAHVLSAAGTGERAVGGVTTGLMELGDEVTWAARHLGFDRRLTSRITAFDRPKHFRDSMVRGAFARFDHDHFLKRDGDETLVRDRFDFTTQWGVLGRIVDGLLLKRHMRRFLVTRMEAVKSLAESGEGQQLLSGTVP